MPWIWISHQKFLKFKVGMAGPFFESHLLNLVRIHFSLTYKNAEVFVRLSQMACDLAKISVSVLFISLGVLDRVQRQCGMLSMTRIFVVQGASFEISQYRLGWW